MINEFKIKIESLIGKPTNQKLLVAVSGGVDSIVLAHFLVKLKYNISIAHVNYELRGISSEYDEEIVRKFSKNFNLKIFVKRNSLLNEDTGIQEKARKVRYSWFNNLRLKYNFDFIITAHHANDQIETFFLMLARGSGISGLSAMEERKNYLIRPLLTFNKKSLINYAKLNNIKWREDKSNESDNYLRNRIRNSLLPNLLEIKSDIESNILNSIQNIKGANTAVENVCLQIKSSWTYKDNVIEIPESSFVMLKPLKFWIHCLFNPYGFDFKEVEKILNTKRGKKCEIKKYTLYRAKDMLILSEN